MKEFDNLLNIMEILRSEKGCPWDREQTRKSLRPYIIEESYELVDAIDNEEKNDIVGELGDVILQVVFHAQVAKENNEFDIKDVLNAISNKMIRRHPHVFKNDGDYSYERWEELKAKEKNKKIFSIIGEYKRGVPPIIQIRRLIENSFAVDFDPFYGENISEKIISYSKEKDYEKVLEIVLYELIKEKKDPEKVIKDISKNYYEKFLKMENESAEKFKQMSLKEKSKVWNKF